MEILNTLFQLMADKSPYVLDALLLFLVGYLFWERCQFNKIIAHQTQAMEQLSKNYNNEIRSIIEKYHQGNIELTQALNEIKMVLAAMIRNV